MNDDLQDRLRGLYSQLIAAQQDVVFALADRKFSESRKRELTRRLNFMVQQLSEME